MEYFIKSSAILGIFYLFYKLVLHRETFFQSNRFFLLVGLFAAVLIPLIVIPIYIEQPQILLNDFTISNPNEINEVQSTINWLSILSTIYFIGVLFFGIKFLISLISLAKLIFSNTKKKIDGLYFIKSSTNSSPFSFFNYIIYNPNQFKQQELEQILTHEKVHAYQWHSFDVLTSQLITTLYWFNPLSWLYKKELQQNLEFIADSISQEKTTCKKTYQHLLLKTSISKNQLALTNNFYNSLIKKRIIMLHKNRSKKTSQWKLTLIIPLILAFIFTFNTKVISQNYKVKENKIHEVHEDTQMVLITKDTDNESLDNIKDEFSKEGVTVKFKNIKRNNNGEIIAIKIEVDSKQSSANYNTHSADPIKPIKISFDNEGGNIAVGSSNIQHGKGYAFISKDGKHKIVSNGEGNQSFVFISEDGKHDKHEVIEIKGDGDNTFIIKKNGDKQIIDLHNDKDKNVWVTKKGDKKIEIIDIKEGLGDHKVFVHTDEKNTPIFYVDGKEVSKEDIEKLDSDSIERVDVIKGEKALKKYGKKAKDGVIDITTKKK